MPAASSPTSAHGMAHARVSPSWGGHNLKCSAVPPTVPQIEERKPCAPVCHKEKKSLSVLVARRAIGYNKRREEKRSGSFQSCKLDALQQVRGCPLRTTRVLGFSTRVWY